MRVRERRGRRFDKKRSRGKRKINGRGKQTEKRRVGDIEEQEKWIGDRGRRKGRKRQREERQGEWESRDN